MLSLMFSEHKMSHDPSMKGIPVPSPLCMLTDCTGSSCCMLCDWNLLHACRSGLGLAAGEPAIVTNGRVTRLEGLEPLLAEDFRLLDQYANTAQVAKQVT